jgi:multidrug transporter EmrE-like cation transporter
MSPMTPQQMEERAPTLELINVEITASIARQATSGRNLDTKAVLLIGYAGAAASFLATRHAKPVLAAFAYAAYAAAAAAGIWVAAVRVYQDVPEPRRLFTEYLARSRAETLAALAASRVDAFESNTRKQARKATAWWISLGCLAAGMILMILAASSTYW